ncbi:MAG: hypothetical protein J6O55_02905 [Lachnospiraceae bacterium]|nr:hypothetical protein [Lachnospiraceae bacterium]
MNPEQADLLQKEKKKKSNLFEDPLFDMSKQSYVNYTPAQGNFYDAEAYRLRFANMPQQGDYMSLQTYDYKKEGWKKLPVIPGLGLEKQRSIDKAPEDYIALNGHKPALSSKEMKKLREELLRRKGFSQDALKQTEKAGKNKKESYQVVTEMKHKDTENFNFHSDREFIDKYTKEMPFLQRADELYSDLMKGGSVPEMDEKDKKQLLKDLSWFKEVKDAYEERMSIISSDYYANIRDRNFTARTRMWLQEQGRKKNSLNSFQAFAQSMVRWKDKYENTFDGGQIFDAEKMASIEKRHSLEKQNEKEDGIASGRTIKLLMQKLGKKTVNFVLNERTTAGHEMLTREKTFKDLRIPATQQMILNKVGELQEKVDKTISSQTDEDKLNSLNDEKKRLVWVREAVGRGKVGLDVGRMWLERSLSASREKDKGIMGALNDKEVQELYSLFGEKEKAGAEKQDDKEKKLSYTDFIMEAFCQSAFIANNRMGKKANEKVDMNDLETLVKTKEVFREMCIMYGINPASMAQSPIGSMID